MGAFSYAVLDSAGKQHRGSLEADNVRHARQLLRDRGMVPLDVAEVTADRRAGNDRNASSRASLSVAGSALFTRQLATLIQSALPIADALAAIAQQSEKAATKGLISSLRTQVLEGRGLAAAMSLHPRAFPSMYRATVAAGEHTGRLDLVLNRLADHTEASHRARQKVQLALIYPCVLLGLAVVVVAGLLTYIVPDVVGVFAREGQALPPLTQALLAISDFLVGYGVWLLFGIVAGVFAVRASLKDAARLEWVHKVLLGVPLAGRLSLTSNTARFTGTLSTLVSSGVPLVDALDIAAAVLTNTHLKRIIGDTAGQVREGSSLKAALERSGRFPPMMIHMIASGEVSGDLERMLGRVAESQQVELDNRIATMIGLFEPAVLLFMGVAVLFIVVAILQPIFSLNQMI
ncbi:MAG: type II secretion system inner membrane protein GspF [Pseudomonadales bacterium]|nr:type II secretion system inner membrane protein GspF [Gammaproteobacteria bacterium]MBK7521379.1 type II secretion system inner membrane protein GspF [Gammaproteobacteria bacterium]MBK8307810.1 type II secretion system inner membrane protein GspF [Gammaproteobacteria bacterium]MBP6052844.1 type II secretion system inner membrane protein GspF [Pseudomonadales bacterium]MBP6227784.1 type II secretion system inner membrane protein GspF [Pseudomonadales bacterium]